MDATYEILLSLAYVALGMIVLIVAKIVQDKLTSFPLDEELTTKDNHAVGLTTAGYFAGVMIVFLGATAGGDFDPDDPDATGTLAISMLIDLGYAIGGVLLLNLGRVLVDKLLLYKFSTKKEIITDRNLGTAAVEAGSYIATGLIVAGAIHGDDSGGIAILASLAFFALGQAALVAFARLYQWETKFDIHDEIEKDNVAAGVALGLNLIAIGVILFGAIAGEFISWKEGLSQFGYFAILGCLLLFLLRKVTDRLLLPGTTIAHEIAKDKNLNAAWIEGIVSVGMATVILFMV